MQSIYRTVNGILAALTATQRPLWPAGRPSRQINFLFGLDLVQFSPCVCTFLLIFSSFFNFSLSIFSFRAHFGPHKLIQQTCFSCKLSAFQFLFSFQKFSSFFYENLPLALQIIFKKIFQSIPRNEDIKLDAETLWRFFL